MPERNDAPAWLRYAAEFGQALSDATRRTGVGAEAFLAIATDLRAIRALLDLAMRTNTITGYSMGHRPDPARPDVEDEEMLVTGEIALNDEILEQIICRRGPSFHRGPDDRSAFLSVPDETVNP